MRQGACWGAWPAITLPLGSSMRIWFIRCFMGVLAKKVRVMNTRVKYLFLGFRLIIGYLENALKGGIYSLLWA